MNHARRSPAGRTAKSEEDIRALWEQAFNGRDLEALDSVTEEPGARRMS